MIDTIRFRIRVNDVFVQQLKSASMEWAKYDNKRDELHYKFYKADVSLGSYDRNINIFYSESDDRYAYIEFSLPKYAYGHNVYLVYYPEITQYLEEFYKNLRYLLHDIPHYTQWVIMRLDLCYSWKFPDNETAQQVLELLKGYDFSRKDKYIYDTSVMYRGSAYSIKFYMKHPEFYRHDFKNLLFRDTQYAHQIEQTSVGVLRFEVTMRRVALQQHFEKKCVTISDIDNKFLHEKITFYFTKFFKGGVPIFMATSKVFATLALKYGKEQARSLYLHYIMLNNTNSEEKRVYLSSIARQTLYNMNSKIKKANIGIRASHKPMIDSKFTIPSEYCVNSVSVPRAEARGTVL